MENSPVKMRAIPISQGLAEPPGAALPKHLQRLQHLIDQYELNCLPYNRWTVAPDKEAICKQGAAAWRKGMIKGDE